MTHGVGRPKDLDDCDHRPYGRVLPVGTTNPVGRERVGNAPWTAATATPVTNLEQVPTCGL